MYKRFFVATCLVINTFAQALDKDVCNLEVIKTIKSVERNTNISLKKINLIKSESSSSYISKSFLILQSGKNGEISVNEDKVNIHCLASSTGNYSLDIELITKTENQQSQIKTTIDITKNQKINLANIVEELKVRGNELSLKNVKYNKKQGHIKYDYFLELK